MLLPTLVNLCQFPLVLWSSLLVSLTNISSTPACDRYIFRTCTVTIDKIWKLYTSVLLGLLTTQVKSRSHPLVHQSVITAPIKHRLSLSLCIPTGSFSCWSWLNWLQHFRRMLRAAAVAGLDASHPVVQSHTFLHGTQFLCHLQPSCSRF